MTKWPLVQLGDVLQLQRRWVKVDPLKKYEEIGVRCFGKGIFHKAPIDGSTLGNKRVLRIEPGDLVFNNVFAWEGAVAVASEAESGKIGSHRFVTYTADTNRCSVDYLRWFFKSEPGLEVLRRVSPGSAGRNRTMSLDQLPKQEVPLPSLKEQQRLVEYLDAVSAKVDEAKRLREQVTLETPAIFAARLKHLWNQKNEWTVEPLGQLVITVCGQVDPKAMPYSQLPHINGEFIESGTGRLLPGFRSAGDDGVTSGKYHFQPNAILYSKIRPYLRKAVQIPFEGVCSADVYAFSEVSDKLLPRFLLYSLVGFDFTKYANDLSGRTRMPKLNQGQLFRYPLPYPPKDQQAGIVHHLDSLQERLPRLTTAQEEVSIELEAFMHTVLDSVFTSA